MPTLPRVYGYAPAYAVAGARTRDEQQRGERERMDRLIVEGLAGRFDSAVANQTEALSAAINGQPTIKPLPNGYIEERQTATGTKTKTVLYNTTS